MRRVISSIQYRDNFTRQITRENRHKLTSSRIIGMSASSSRPLAATLETSLLLFCFGFFEPPPAFVSASPSRFDIMETMDAGAQLGTRKLHIRLIIEFCSMTTGPVTKPTRSPPFNRNDTLHQVTDWSSQGEPQSLLKKSGDENREGRFVSLEKTFRKFNIIIE